MLEHIEETAGYFKPEFLSKHTGFPESMFVSIQENHEAVFEILRRQFGKDLSEFIFLCVKAEKTGYGHFLNYYDGTMYKVNDYIIMRLD